MAFYANRRRSYEEIAPWSHIDMLVSREFLIEENKRAHAELQRRTAARNAPAAA